MISKRNCFVLTCLACLGLAGWTGSQDFSKIQIQSVRVAEGAYLLYGAGGNIGVSAGADGILLVDSQFGELHEKIKASIAEFNPGSIRFVLNTNGHYDHASGNVLFRNDRAVIVAHENARKRMATEQIHDVIGSKTAVYSAAALPEVTFAESLVLHLNSEDIQAIHVVNAHSDSDALYWFHKANVIHTGDVFFSDGYPYIDIGNGGSVNGMIAAADKVIGMSDENTKIIPGHGRLSDRKRLQDYRAMLATVRDRVAKMIKEGKRLEDVIGLKPTASLDKDWNVGLGMPADMFVTIVYKDLSR
jgi:cyclase